MTDTVHNFAIPHECVQPTRDMVLVRLPLSPTKIGNIVVPDFSRDMAQHNVIVGRVVAMGPLAFVYKDAEGELTRQPVKIGDWVIFRPYAGTQTTGGKISISKWRLLSSFQDITAYVPADEMPKHDFLWTEAEVEAASIVSAAKMAANFGGQPRERVKVRQVTDGTNNARS